jgi:hypothetical protein
MARGCDECYCFAIIGSYVSWRPSFPLVLFGNNVTEVANTEIPPICSIVMQHGNFG